MASITDSHQLQQQSDHPSPSNNNTVGARRRRRRPPPPRWYLLLSNPSKTTHLGTLLRCAAAFQVHQFLLVGCDKFNCRGSFGSHLFLDIVVFRSWEKVGEYLRLGGDYIDNNSSDDDNCDGNKNDAQDDESTCRISQDTSGDTICRGKEDIHTSEEENVEQCRRPITIIGILGAYGGGEDIFSPDGVEVHTDEDSYVSLVPPKVVDSLNAEDNRTDAAAACLSSHSFPISARPFPSDDICFLLSKDKRGLPLSQARLCSKFIHVPHLSFDNDPSPTMQQPSHMPETNANDGIQISHSTLIDTATTLSIVLHHYTAWAGYEERSFAEDQKFVKDVKPNERRRLCRIFGDEGTRTMRHNDDESMNNFEEQYGRETLFYWNEADGDDSRGSDY